jgi:hypothetical protein
MGTKKTQSPFTMETPAHREHKRISLCLCVPVVNLDSVGYAHAREVN